MVDDVAPTKNILKLAIGLDCKQFNKLSVHVGKLFV